MSDSNDLVMLSKSEIDALPKLLVMRVGISTAMVEHENGKYITVADLRALLEKATPCGDKPVKADFYQLDNGSDYWYECPDDEAIISDLDDAVIGTEYTVFASHTYRQTYRITKIPDETSDDTEVELVSSQRSYYTTPQVPETLNTLNQITAIAHCGGWVDMKEYEVNVAIRKLTRRIFSNLDKTKSKEEIIAMITEAMKGQ